MTRRVALPTEPQVREALAQIQAAELSGPPTALALARRLGLTNATFWRHFPQIAQEVADARRQTLRSSVPADESSPAGTDTKGEIARLCHEKARLRAQIESAAAHIQRLTLENHVLREQLEQAAGVARMPQRR